MESRIKIKLFWSLLSGKASRKTHLIALIIILIFYFSCSLYAQNVYPTGFSIFYSHISVQGSIKWNPDGYLIFNIASFITGLLMIPHFLYVYRRLIPTTLLLTRIATLFGIIGSIGVSLLGLLPFENENHFLASYLSFNGFAFSALLFFIVLTIKYIKAKDTNIFYFLLVVYLIIFINFYLIAYIPNNFYLASKFNIDPKWFNHAFWQWIGFYTLLFWIISLILIPDNQFKMDKSYEKMEHKHLKLENLQTSVLVIFITFEFLFSTAEIRLGLLNVGPWILILIISLIYWAYMEISQILFY